MHLNVTFPGTWESEDIDLKPLWDLEQVVNEDTMAEVLKIHIAGLAIENDTDFNEVELNHVIDGNDDALAISTNSGVYGVREVAQLVWHLYYRVEHEDEFGKVLGYIEYVGWRYYDFDFLSRLNDDYVSEYDGDPAEYAQEYLSDTDTEIPEHLAPYFDYEEYGRDLLEDYDVVKWGNKEYLYSK